MFGIVIYPDRLNPFPGRVRHRDPSWTTNDRNRESAGGHLALVADLELSRCQLLKITQLICGTPAAISLTTQIAYAERVGFEGALSLNHFWPIQTWTARYCLVIGGWALLGARGLWELQLETHRARRDSILIGRVSRQVYLLATLRALVRTKSALPKIAPLICISTLCAPV